MCGIIGYLGDKDIVPLLIDALEGLEYRGYDSAGVCVGNGNLRIVKKTGKVSEIEMESVHGNVGIAHTRWATHGGPSELNAHPHTDCKKEIAIVHNGIIENYHSLKTALKKEGHNIISDTDSEIVAHLIEKFYSGDLEDAVINSLKCVEGTFGLAVIHRDWKCIIAASRGSPLILGVGDKEYFVSSDIIPIMKHTKKVVYLDDNEIAKIKPGGFSIKNFKKQNIDKKVSEIEGKVSQIEKKGFKHFMLKEIFEQPQSLENTLRGRIKNSKIRLTLDLDINHVKRFILIGCGTSWHACLIGKYLIEGMTRIPVEVDYASEFRYRKPVIKEGDLVIALSQSGETADTLAALKEVKKREAKTLGIINVAGSTISREVDSGIYLHAGPEIGVASTKAFTSQVAALILLALYFNQEREIEMNKKILNDLKMLPDKVKDALKLSEKIKRIAENFSDSTNFLYLGRGLNFPVALEGALKLKEISYIHAEGYPAAEMKHGPIALIDKSMPVVFLATNLSEKVLSNMEEVKSRGGKIISLINEGERVERLSDYIIKVPKIAEELSTIVNSVPLQLLAYYIADFKGLDVDRPRNLAKSVTVE